MWGHRERTGCSTGPGSQQGYSVAGFTAPSVDGKTWPSPDLSNCRCSQPEASLCPRRAPGGPMQFFFSPTLDLTAGCQQPCKNSLFTLLCILLPPPTYHSEKGIEHCGKPGPSLSSTKTLGKHPEWSRLCPRKPVRYNCHGAMQ